MRRDGTNFVINAPPRAGDPEAALAAIQREIQTRIDNKSLRLTPAAAAAMAATTEISFSPNEAAGGRAETLRGFMRTQKLTEVTSDGLLKPGEYRVVRSPTGGQTFQFYDADGVLSFLAERHMEQSYPSGNSARTDPPSNGRQTNRGASSAAAAGSATEAALKADIEKRLAESKKIKGATVQIVDGNVRITVGNPGEITSLDVAEAIGMKPKPLDRYGANRQTIVVSLEELEAGRNRGMGTTLRKGAKAAGAWAGKFIRGGVRVLVPAALAYAGLKALEGNYAEAAQAVVPGATTAAALNNGASPGQAAATAGQEVGTAGVVGGVVGRVLGTGAAAGGIAGASMAGAGVILAGSYHYGPQAVGHVARYEQAKFVNDDMQALLKAGVNPPPELSEIARSMNGHFANGKSSVEAVSNFGVMAADKMASWLQEMSKNEEGRARIMKALDFKSPEELKAYIEQLNLWAGHPPAAGAQTASASTSSSNPRLNRVPGAGAMSSFAPGM